MTDCECPSGDYGCSCCCASVTGLRAGIHPDYIKSAHTDIFVDRDDGSRTFESRNLVSEPVHIISATVSLACVRRNTGTSQAEMDEQLEEPDGSSVSRSFQFRGITPVMFSLFTIPGWDPTNSGRGGWAPHESTGDGRSYICTGSVSSPMPSWEIPPDLFGYFCDGGLFVEMNAANEMYGLRVVINYIDRVAFSPAYGDPVKVLQHYWSCAHGDQPFLDGFYAGQALQMDSGTSDDLSAASSKDDTGTNPFSDASTAFSIPT